MLTSWHHTRIRYVNFIMDFTAASVIRCMESLINLWGLSQLTVRKCGHLLENHFLCYHWPSDDGRFPFRKHFGCTTCTMMHRCSCLTVVCIQTRQQKRDASGLGVVSLQMEPRLVELLSLQQTLFLSSNATKIRKKLQGFFYFKR